jgi:starch-binding outer membrane protein, SusD/RagB family
MKRILNKFSIAVFSIALTMVSCSKSYLDKSPSDSLLSDQALSTVAGLGDALNGAYSGMRSATLYGRDFPVIGDLQADNTFVESKNSGRYLSQYNYSVVVNDGVVSEMWTNAYLVILRANRILQSTLTGADVDAIKAQAYAIRALMYFKLVNIYAKPYTDDPNSFGVPLITKYDPFLYPARNTVKEVYTQIVSDLTTAFANAPAYDNSVHISKYAVEGFLAKVYLYMGDNTNAKTAAVDVINNGGFQLTTPANYQTYWGDPAIRTDQLETLFEVDADVINNNGFDDLGGIYANGYQDIYASSQLVSLYSATDIRNSVLIKDTTTKSGASTTIVYKYSNATNGDRDNLKVMRLSEVYLIAAEASLPGNEADALKYLNGLVSKRDPSLVYASTGAQLLNDIVTERRKELAFEGDRFYDLNRLKLPVARVANPGAIPAGTGNVNLNVPYSSTKRLAPIPQSEFTVNKNIATQQNPGY